jgi:alpha-L-rhamnosidase
MHFLVILVLTTLGPVPAAADAAALSPAGLRCEGRKEPLGIDAQRPRLSWILASDERGQKQTGYRLLAAATPEALMRDEGDLWDSGTVESADSLGIEWAGKPLRSGQRVHWKVSVFDRRGAPSAWSPPASFEMALLAPAEWKAGWIRRKEAPPATEDALFEDRPAPLLRKEFTLRAKPVRARAYVTGLGFYELRLNGEKAGDQVLDPGWTAYAKRVLYSIIDVTALLREGPNAAGILLGSG